MSPDDAPEPRPVSWIEPFFDIAFAAAVGQVGRALTAAPGLEPVLRVVFLQALLWWTWLGYLHYVTRLDPDAPRARALTLLQVVAGVFLAANADDRLDSASTAGGVAAYGAMRLMLAAQFHAARHTVPHAEVAQAQVRGLVPAAVLWLASALLPVPWRFGLWGPAIALELRLEWSAWRLTATSPPDPRHLPERFGLFTLILLGETLMAVMRGIQQQPSWHWRPLSAAVGSLAAICLVWWTYFVRLDAAAARPVTTPRELRGVIGWSYAHLPLFLGLALGAVLAEAAIRDGASAMLDTRRIVTLGLSLAGTLVGLTALAWTARHRTWRPASPDCDRTRGW